MRIFCYHKSKDIFWFRIFGGGICFRKSRLMKFSERNGFKKYLMVGDWIITLI